jgi:hypothetical protein
MPANNSTLKKLSEIFCDIVSLKDKMWEADPDLKRSMPIYQCKGKAYFSVASYTRSKALNISCVLIFYILPYD